jgi:hypothetical protein
MITFSKTDKSLTVIVMEDGKNTVLTTTSANPSWNKILEALKNQNQSELVQLMSIKGTIERYTESNVEIKDSNVFFKGRQLHGLDVSRMLEFAKEGVPFLPLARFLEKKAKNPSYRSINELYNFLEHRKMPLTPNGTVLGYKGVQSNYFSVMGNTATIMISGETDSGGHILNTVGANIRCDRNCVCDDYRQGCSPGLHIGSLEYALGWGAKVVIVEFDPADVVSVPDDCECQKLRACAYKVVGEYTGAMPDTYSDKYEPVMDEANAAGDGEDDDPYKDTTHASYLDGYNTGLKDGKAHRARKHYVTDLDDEDLTNMETSYIEGYDDGYRKGRYNKNSDD